ncbi:MAG: class I SAM-dependent methyltransferase [Chloroflexota bacterium]
MTTPRACPVCEGEALVPIVERAGAPVHQNLIYQTAQAAVSARRGDLSMVACARCGFVFNRAFDASRLEYGDQYDNTQLLSDVFKEHVAGLLRHLLDERAVRGARIVEVGCGKGAFIRALIADEAAGNTGVGYDPSYVGPEVEFGGRLHYERRFYDAGCLAEPADVVVSRHVVEHVADPVALIQVMATALKASPDARVFLETPCVEWILRNNVVWDFFYEHCSLFTARSLTVACQRAGLTVDRVDHVFGGQYLWLEASNRPPEHVELDPGQVPDHARAFAETQVRETERLRGLVRSLAGRQRLAVWGAGAKGITFANLIDPEREYVACLVDVNPTKQGGFVAGTGHPIVGPADLGSQHVTCALVLNPNYQREIEAMARASGLSLDVLAVESP